MPRRRAARGFTLIELMSVAAVAAILIAVGAPPLGEFMADQRVRSTASDIAAEIAFARAKAIENSRRAYIERTGGEWRNGWRVYVDLNNSGGITFGQPLAGSFTAAANGRTTMTLQTPLGTQNLVVYLVNGTRALFVEIDGAVVAAGDIRHQ